MTQSTLKILYQPMFHHSSESSLITIIGASPCLDRVDDQRIREKFLAHKPVRGQDGIVRLVLIDELGRILIQHDE